MGLRLGLYAMAAVLLACAVLADDGAAEPRQLPKATGNCIIIRTIDSWRPIDRRHMVVSASRQWIVEFLSPCLGIRRTEDVGFAARDGRLCDFRTDVVIAAGERCRVGSIRPYVEEVDKELEEELEQIEESLSCVLLREFRCNSRGRGAGLARRAPRMRAHSRNRTLAAACLHPVAAL